MAFINKITQFLSKILFRLYHYILLPLRYKVTVKGFDQLQLHKTDPNGGYLFLSNHPSHLDASFLGTSIYKEGQFVSIWTMDFVFKNPYTRMVARSPHTTKLLKVPNVHEMRSFKNPIKVRKLIRRTVEGLQEGENVLFFPAGYQKFSGREEISGKSAVERILKQYPNANIVLVRLTGMWGSRFSKAVRKSERSSAKGTGWYRFVWGLVKMIVLNLVFFIPKRKVLIEFEAAGPDFPRHGTRREINKYMEDFYNRGLGIYGEPLQRVPDYFWKHQYVPNEYHLKSYHYDEHLIPNAVKEDVLDTISRVSKIDRHEISADMLIDRDLCMDSLEIVEVLTELEARYHIPQYVPKNISTVGHLMALTAGIPVESVPILGEFPEVRHEVGCMHHAWQVCASFIAGLFGFLDTQR